MLTLTGINTYSLAGTFQVGSGGTTGSIAGDVTDNAALAFNRSDSFTFAGNITGIGCLTQAGSGDSTAGGVTDNALLAFTLSDWLTFSGNMAGSGSLAKAGAGTLTGSGANTYTSLTKINGGNLAAQQQCPVGQCARATAATAGRLASAVSRPPPSAASRATRAALTNASSQSVALSVGGNNASATPSGILSGGG